MDAKRVYYLSMEFLMGRSLLNALNNLGVVDQYTEALREMGYKLEDLIEKARLSRARAASLQLYRMQCSCKFELPRSPAPWRCCLITTRRLMTGLCWACDGSAFVSAVFSYHGSLLSHCARASGCLNR